MSMTLRTRHVGGDENQAPNKGYKPPILGPKPILKPVPGNHGNHSNYGNRSTTTTTTTPLRRPPLTPRGPPPVNLPYTPQACPLLTPRGPPAADPLRTPNPPPTPTPLGMTPRVLEDIKRRLEERRQQALDTQDKVSPVLQRLRDTPALKTKQRLLEKKHHAAKSNAASLCVGGGVSLWPQMDNMRLTRRETVALTTWCVGLVLVVQALFSYLHGHVIRKLHIFTGHLRRFYDDHKLEVTRGQEQFDTSVLRWHTDYRNLMDAIEKDFHVSVGGAPVLFQLSLLLYLLSICTLLYYLGDNMLSKSKLTPKRIKLWVSLLVVTGVWTLLGLKLLTTAQHLESTVETTVYQLSEELGDLVLLDHDLSRYHSVLRYWQYRCTPPTSPGVLSILGILQVRDVNYYLQYYSLPVITALCTPVVRLVLALKQVYSPA
ncbi:uncharacterized protein [Branchiostoma lanceolatum]|uniref:uncharacterized protein n=1 Tax=Branchiostoma lanceolatum TaxID=7740 RepID=UPI003454C2CC